MRHAVSGRKLSRTTNERRRLFAGLIRDLIIRDGITTTIAKAKAIQPLIEKLITKAKSGSEVDRRRVDATLTDRKITAQLFDEAKTRFAGRSSGFTRIIKLGKRKGDATDVAQISFVDQKVVVEMVAPKKAKQEAVKPVEKKSVAGPKAKKETVKKQVKKVEKKTAKKE
ncbi:50S ribosomal protein L17 [Candidatus Gottesmanbacteria bacterium RIFCSPLOWO2_01_FULL_46_9]|uniref:50S ribosomal protein L17 n=1 Tax=Candidatus Gottesmanbacteria bacterium RIFCSPLOWO2_01_FULL_46_9 TaxID=1798394 RepID=A0A1F6B3G2_9BACT|nr:MAG: 50S ribosomal protein L17 [Candidatus Gottesmanbacteria bacterium RIFCSPLOWO2_01_FULL_46_9]